MKEVPGSNYPEENLPPEELQNFAFAEGKNFNLYCSVDNRNIFFDLHKRICTFTTSIQHQL